MNLKIRLTLFSSLVFTIIFGLATLVIYWIFYNSSERHLISSLEKNAKIAGIYYLEADEQSPLKHLESKNQYESLVKRAMVAVYNAEGRVSYGGLKSDSQINKSLLTQLKSQKKKFILKRRIAFISVYIIQIIRVIFLCLSRSQMRISAIS